jgi:hypothetical protein
VNALAPGWRIALDPLIAEAKRRARRRRILMAFALLVVAGGAATWSELRAPRAGLVERAGESSGSIAAAGRTVPYAVFTAVHGIPLGWARTGKDWFVVYVDRRGNEWCGLGHDSWRVALVAAPAAKVLADRRISGAGCGNQLSWVRAGRFSDGVHREAAFLLWATPAIGATAYVFRVGADRLRLLATFGGDRVVLGRDRAVVSFENQGRSPHGELEDVYRFAGGRYRLVRRR